MSTTDPITSLGDENMAPGIGDNNADELEAQAFDKAMRQMIDLSAQRAELNARITKARKRMKADGIVLKHLDATIAMMAWEPAEVREHFAVQHRYAKYANLPVGTQLDLMEHAEDDEVSAADWYGRGWSAAVTGKGVPGLPPDHCPPERQQNWLEGWNDGQVKNAPRELATEEEWEDAEPATDA